MIKTSNTTFIFNNSDGQKTRLDKFLFSQFPQYSRAYFQELIETGLVLVNQNRTKSNYHLKQTDQINVTFKTKEYNLDPLPIEFDIIDQQDDFLVINKPAGLLVHGIPGSDESSLVNGLLYHFKEIKSLGGNERPGIVHRLDKNTSGLMIVARNQQAHARLSEMFKNRQVHKTYLAVASGTPPKSGSIDLPIGRHPIDRHKMATFGIDTRPALTHYETLATYQGAALIAAKIVTGRTHQVRVHCASLGHGLLGDSVYGIQHSDISRQALHAWKVFFEFQGKSYHYTCPLPNDLKTLVQKLNAEKRNL